MTDEMMTLRTLLEKSSDTDLLREMIGFTAQRLMALEVESLTGAGAKDRAKQQAFQRATKALESAGYIGTADDFVWLARKH